MIPIMNEIEYVESLISSTTFPEKLSVSTCVTYLTKYFYEKLDSLIKIENTVFEQMKKYNLSVEDYQEYKFKKKVTNIYNSLKEEKLERLKVFESIPLNKSENDAVMLCENDREKKILFTLYILARYTGRFGWVYQTRKEIYQLANVTYNNDTKHIIYDLLHKGLIKNTKKIDDEKIGVNLSNSEEQVILEITKMNSLGNQLMVNLKSGIKLC